MHDTARHARLWMRSPIAPNDGYACGGCVLSALSGVDAARQSPGTIRSAAGSSSSCRYRWAGPFDPEDPASPASAVPANKVLLADAELCRAELLDRGSRLFVPFVGAQLNPFGAVAEDHREQQPLDRCVDTGSPYARVEQRPADLCAGRVLGVKQDRGNADGAPALPDGEGRPVAAGEPGPDDLV